MQFVKKFYTTTFLGQKFYTLKTVTSQLFPHNKCINKIEIECVKLQQFHRKAKYVLVKEQNLWVNIIFVWIICTKTRCFLKKKNYTAGKYLHDKFQLCEHSYVKWLIFE